MWPQAAPNSHIRGVLRLTRIEEAADLPLASASSTRCLCAATNARRSASWKLCSTGSKSGTVANKHVCAPRARMVNFVVSFECNEACAARIEPVFGLFSPGHCFCFVPVYSNDGAAVGTTSG